MLVGGLAIGVLARVVMPGPRGFGLVATIAVGVVGALFGGLVGGLVAQAVVAGTAARWVINLLFSVIGAVLVLWTVQMIRRT